MPFHFVSFNRNHVWTKFTSHPIFDVIHFSVVFYFFFCFTLLYTIHPTIIHMFALRYINVYAEDHFSSYYVEPYTHTLIGLPQKNVKLVYASSHNVFKLRLNLEKPKTLAIPGPLVLFLYFWNFPFGSDP